MVSSCNSVVVGVYLVSSLFLDSWSGNESDCSLLCRCRERDFLKKIHECMEREGKVASHLNKNRTEHKPHPRPLMPPVLGQEGSNTGSTEPRTQAHGKRKQAWE